MKINREKFFLLRSEDKQLNTLFRTPSKLLTSRRILFVKYTAIFAYALMLIMQIWLLVSFSGEPTSDAARYTGDALSCVQNGSWFPTAEKFVGNGGVAGTGYVNFLCLLFRITNNIKIAYAANILLVQLMLFSTAYITKKVTGSDTVHYSVVAIFCLFGTYWSEICFARTEIFFTALAFFALALVCSGKKSCAVFAGVVLAYANWARPLAMSFIIAILWLFFYKRSRIFSYVKFASGFAAAVLIIMTFTYINSGKFIYQPTVASGNLLIGANDDADGSYDNVVFKEGHAGYIDPEKKKTMSYEEINSVYSKAATEWIKENPLKYISLMPRKLLYFFVSETYSGDVYFNNGIQTGGAVYIREVLSILHGDGDRTLQTGDVLIIYTQIFYMFVFALFIAGVIFSAAKGYWRSMSFLYGLIIIGAFISMLTVGGARYHFPYLPTMIISAAQLTDAALVRRSGKDITEQ